MSSARPLARAHLAATPNSGSIFYLMSGVALYPSSFFVSVASKGFSVFVNSLESTFAGIGLRVDSK